jgi:erythromycin esterase
MADNLYWLYHGKYAGKKMIVWAANGHIARHMNTASPKLLFYNETTGNEIYKRLKDTVYALACTSYSGSFGGTYGGAVAYNKHLIHTPHGECLENWVHSKGFNYGFIDFKKYKGNSKFKMAGAMAMHSETEARWGSIFDGVFYIRQMFPPDEIK